MRRNAWWIALTLVAVCLVALAAAQAGASSRRGINEIFDTAGLVGVVPGQAARFNVSNVSEGQCRARLELVTAQGSVAASRTATIAADKSVSLRFQPGAKTLVRSRVVSIAQSCPAMMTSLEVVDAGGRTVALVSGSGPVG
jgi:hypothetical protein